MSVYIARSALATFLLEVAQLREPGVSGLWLDFATMAPTGCNWRVARIEAGGASQLSAQAAVDEAVRRNTEWVMVEDGDPRDGCTADEFRPDQSGPTDESGPGPKQGSP